MVSFEDFQWVLIILVCGVIGVVFAMFMGVLNDNGILIDEFVTGTASLNDLQAFTIGLSLVVGVVAAAIKK